VQRLVPGGEENGSVTTSYSMALNMTFKVRREGFKKTAVSEKYLSAIHERKKELAS